jgi:hypothetical protein
MLQVNNANTIDVADVPWSNVISVDVDRIAWETWTKHADNGEPAEGASLLDAGHHFAAMVVYHDDTWHTVGWSDAVDEIKIFATKLASDVGLPLNFSPAMAAYFRALN